MVLPKSGRPTGKVGRRRHLRSKCEWSRALGASPKAKRLHLRPDPDGFFVCPVETCDHPSFLTVRGCRKHTCEKHPWFFFFDRRPRVGDVFPKSGRSSQAPVDAALHPPRKASTASMPSFDSSCTLSRELVLWLTSDGGGSKSLAQAEQVACRIRKYIRFCFPDEESTWDFPDSVLDSSITCTNKILLFLSHLRDTWHLGYSGQIGFVNSLFDAIDFRKCLGAFASNTDILSVVEVFLTRTRRSLSRKMRLEWNTLLDVDMLERQRCWASIEDLQTVLPYHLPRFNDIIERAREEGSHVLPAHDLSFCTRFICGLLFLGVKATRPMTYRFLTLKMIESIEGDSGTIDATKFKTCKKYGFDSLIFQADHLYVLRSYIQFVRPRLPKGPYLLVTRHGNMMSKLSSILATLVHQACQRYISPTRLRQIIETESANHLTAEQQSHISEDQKHSSSVARIHYKKQRSRAVAAKAKEALAVLGMTSSIAPLLSLPPPDAREERKASLRPIAAIKREKIEMGEEGCPRHFATTATTTLKRSAFRPEEDTFLRNGIVKYGWGHWRSILKDPDYRFLGHRTSRTLNQRAVLKRMKYM